MFQQHKMTLLPSLLFVKKLQQKMIILKNFSLRSKKNFVQFKKKISNFPFNQIKENQITLSLIWHDALDSPCCWLWSFHCLDSHSIAFHDIPGNKAQYTNSSDTRDSDTWFCVAVFCRDHRLCSNKNYTQERDLDGRNNHIRNKLILKEQKIPYLDVLLDNGSSERLLTINHAYLTAK